MSSKKPVIIHKSAIARPVDYSNAQIEVFIFLFHFITNGRPADVARNARCHSDGFNGGEVFSIGRRELKEAQISYKSVDVSSLLLGIVRRRLTRLYVEYIYPYPSPKKNFAHCWCVYCTRNISHIVELKNVTS